MDFPTPSDSMNSNPLTSLQLHELQLLQHQDGDSFKLQQHGNGFSNDMSLNGSTPQNNNNLTADSIFWENNYTSQNLPLLHTPSHHDTNQSPSSISISPSAENDMINECIKRETAVNDGNVVPSQKQDISEEELYLKRKAQNRALQRLFRERKETKLKELSTKLSKTEKEKEKLLLELEKLRQQNTMLSTENQVLLKSGSIDIKDGTVSQPQQQSQHEFSFPINKTLFISDLIANTSHDINKAAKYDTLVYEHQGSKLLTVGAVWDYLHEFSSQHEELEIDVGKVMNLLRGNETCHGFGPGYSLELVKHLIQEVVDGA